ncbi:MAG TPA: hypothetical protein VJ941_10575, partial [Gracilimonas sp.]|nr:hypothetical protein [Gracilimonas sp.]
MDPDTSRDTFLKQLNDEWLKNIENELASHLDKDAHLLKELLQISLDRLKKGGSEKAFNDLLQKLSPSQALQEVENKETEQNDGNDEILLLEAINGITETIPEEAELVQEEGRFIGNEDDTFINRSNKFVKRAWRGYIAGLSKLFTSGDKGSFQVWKQTVPVRSIVKFYFMDLSNWSSSWDNELRKIECDVLLEVEARILHSNDLFQLIREDSEK